MKICLIAGKKTCELLSYLQTNFRLQAEVSVHFQGEDIPWEQADIILSEQLLPSFAEQIERLENPPLLVICAKGSSGKHIRYLTDLQTEFPKIVAQKTPKDPMLCFPVKNETFVFCQKDIIHITSEGCLTIHLRSGKSAVTTESLKSVYARVCRNLFFSVGNRHLINASYVSRFTLEGIHLLNGAIITGTQEELSTAKNDFYKIKFYENLPKN